MTSEYIDLNNMTVFGEEDVCGSVGDFSIESAQLNLAGVINVSDATDWRIVAADKYRRFLSAVTTGENGEWSLSLDMNRLKNLPAKAPLVLYGLRPDANQLFPIQMQSGANDLIEKHIQEIQKKPVDELPSHHGKYIEDIIEATKFRYVSTSIQDDIITGNNYQSVNLKKILREGTRTDRNDFLRQVNFERKSVLDIGANTGEMSRSIRLLGADLVDGVEYDSFFVETGRMVNGVSGATRVSLFQGDVTHPGLYKDKKYDIVVALSVYVYIKGVMKELAEMTDVLVFETHTLDHGLQMYLDSVLPHFPVYQHVGYSQMNNVLTRSRAFLIFAKDQESLDSAFTPKNLIIDSYFNNGFIENNGTTTPENFLEWAKALRSKTDFDTLNAGKFSFGSNEYFLSYIIGYLEYLENGSTVTADNTFVRNFVDAIQKGDLDKKLKPIIEDESSTLQKVLLKYRDFDNCLSGNFHRVPLIFLALDDEGNKKFWSTDGQPYSASNIDGHHRYFIAQLLGIKEMMFMTSERMPKFAEKIHTTYTLAKGE